MSGCALADYQDVRRLFIRQYSLLSPGGFQRLCWGKHIINKPCISYLLCLCPCCTMLHQINTDDVWRAPRQRYSGCRLSALVRVDAEHNSAPRGGFWVWMRLFIQLWKRSAAAQALRRWTAVWQRGPLSFQFGDSKCKGCLYWITVWSTAVLFGGWVATQHCVSAFIISHPVENQTSLKFNTMIFEGLSRYFVLKLLIADILQAQLWKPAFLMKTHKNTLQFNTQQCCCNTWLDFVSAADPITGTCLIFKGQYRLVLSDSLQSP